MKFLVDAQLPRRLARMIESLGHDAIHTLDLPARNLTTDAAVCEFAAREKRVVITKDSDFVDSFVLRGEPPELLLVSTGNISNDELERIFRANMPALAAAFQGHAFVEIDRTGLTIHG